MPLPLNDKNNPLYGLLIHEQCEKLINWQLNQLTPAIIYSLNSTYTAKEVEKAYKHLSMEFHPDKVNRIDSTEAFKIINDAKEYLLYRLKTPVEQQAELTIFKRNPFYGLWQNEHQPVFKCCFRYEDWFNTSSDEDDETEPENVQPPTLKQIFDNLVKQSYELELMPESIELLKKMILSDRSLILTGNKLIHKAAANGQLDFLKWLIKQGMDPFYIEHYDYSSSDPRNAISLAIIYGHLPIVQFYYEQYGKKYFYKQDDSSQPQIPRRWLLELAIQFGQINCVKFLLYDIGFLNNLENKTFDHSYYFYLNNSDNRKHADTALIDLLLNEKLITKPASLINKALYCHKINIAYSLLAHVHKANSQLSLEDIFNNYSSQDLQGENLNKYQHLFYHILSNHAFIRIEIIPQINRVLKENRQFLFTFEPQAILPILFVKLLAYQPEPDVLQSDHLTWKKKILAKCYYKAILHGSIDLLEQLASLSTIPLHEGHYYTPLHKAIYRHYLWLKQQTRYAHQLTDWQKIKARKINEPVFSWLIAQGGEQLIKSIERSYVRRDTSMALYPGYTPLHLACQFGLSHVALQLINQIITENKQATFNDVCTINKIDKGNPFVGPYINSYRYNALHLAIAKNQQDVAVKLVEEGASLTKKFKAKEQKIIWYFFYDIQTTKKTPLQLAIEGKQWKVVSAIQQRLLADYITQREQEDDYTTRISIGRYTLFNCGYHKQTKLTAACQLQAALQQDKNSFISNFKNLKKKNWALSQGRLGEISELSTLLAKHHFYPTCR